MSQRQTAHQKPRITTPMHPTVGIHSPPTPEKFKPLIIRNSPSPSHPSRSVCSTAEHCQAKHVTADGCVVKLRMCREIIIPVKLSRRVSPRSRAQPCAFPGLARTRSLGHTAGQPGQGRTRPQRSLDRAGHVPKGAGCLSPAPGAWCSLWCPKLQTSAAQPLHQIT